MRPLFEPVIPRLLTLNEIHKQLERDPVALQALVKVTTKTMIERIGSAGSPPRDPAMVERS